MKVLRERLPSTLQGRIGRHIPMRIRDMVVGRQFTTGLCWERTPAFALPCGGESFIRLNIKGREKEGFFDPEGPDLKSYLKWVETCLHSLKNSVSGEPLVRDILYSDQVFPGEHSDKLPDIIVVWRDQKPSRQILSEPLGTMRARYQTGRQGLHRSNSFAVRLGENSQEKLPRLQHIADLGDYARAFMGAA